jgi:hypothetical protein
MKLIIITILILTNLAIYSQEVIIDPNLKTDKTSIKTSGYTYEIVSVQIFENDTLKLVFANSGLGGKALVINISDKIIPEIILWTDTPSFDGKYSKSISLESYKMTFNKNKYKNGDLLMAKIECISKPFKPYIGNPIFKYVGEIRQIVKIE